jgi:1,4-alpha-glucan branching enzyme
MEENNMIKGNSTIKSRKNLGKRKVDFTLYAPEAREIFLAGDFNRWNTQSLRMKRDKKGIWKLKTPLPPGRYEYKFYVDSNWFEGSTGTEQVFNPFGTQNFVLKI